MTFSNVMPNPRYCLALAASLLLGGCAAPAADAPSTNCATSAYSLHADFDGGSHGQCEALTVDHVQLTLRPENEPINPSPWYSFHVRGEGALTITLRYPGHKHRYVPKLSRDGQIWRPLDTSAINVSADGQRAQFRLSIPPGGLYVSAQENLTSGWYKAWFAELVARHPDLQLFEAGRSRNGTPLLGIATNPDIADSILLVGRQHPPEVTGAIAMRAFVERLLEGHPDTCKDAPLCEFYRKTNIVFVPLLNPDGVDAGHWRHSFGGLDLNRDWRAFSQPETQAMRALVEQLDAAGAIRLFLDFHSTRRNVFYTQLADNHTQPADFASRWIADARARGIYRFDHAPRLTTHLGTSKNYMHARFGIPAITYEVGDETPRGQIRASAQVFADTMIPHLLPWRAPIETLLIGGLVIDGSGSPPHSANVGIAGDRVVYLGDDTPPARHVVDVSGRFVSPGFIDPHTHARSDLLDAQRSINEAWLRQGVTTVLIGNDGEGEDYTATAQQLNERALGTHVGLFVGHGYLRKQVMGDADRPATDTELAVMADRLEASMRAGAVGLSSGLFYAPGSFADTDELIYLARRAAAHGGVYDSHIRDESAYSIGLLAAVDEVLQIAREADLPAHIAHIKALGPAVWGSAPQLVTRIDAARAEGLSITADQYPWLASGTRLSNALLPRWSQAGGDQALRQRLDTPEIRARIETGMQQNLKLRGGADKLLITGTSTWRGETLESVAARLNLDPVQAAIRIVLDGDPAVASFMMAPADVELLMQQPWVMTGSDGSTGHPRKYGTYPHKYQRYVVNQQTLSLGEFVHRSSALVAETLGLCDRGRIARGYVADIVVWEPERYVSHADYENPTALASGVTDIWVAGQPVVRDEVLTGTAAGYVLRRQDC